MGTAMRLFNTSKGVELAGDVKVAATISTRMKGLLGESSLPLGRALWITRCNSIHTWFMRFRIDAVFVDRELVVRKIVHDIGPWKLTLPALQANSVFELPAGTLAVSNCEIGDRLHVGD